MRACGTEMIDREREGEGEGEGEREREREREREGEEEGTDGRTGKLRVGDWQGGDRQVILVADSCQKA